MRWFNDVWFRIKAVVMPGRMDRELEDEMAFHREMESQKLVAEGMDPGAAEREVRRRFGSQPRQRERASFTTIGVQSQPLCSSPGGWVAMTNQNGRRRSKTKKNARGW